VSKIEIKKKQLRRKGGDRPARRPAPASRRSPGRKTLSIPTSWRKKEKKPCAGHRTNPKKRRRRYSLDGRTRLIDTFIRITGKKTWGDHASTRKKKKWRRDPKTPQEGKGGKLRRKQIYPRRSRRRLLSPMASLPGKKKRGSVLGVERQKGKGRSRPK